MPASRFSVLLRNGTHYQLSQNSSGGNYWGYGTPPRYGMALKCDNVAISYAKTPIQIPIPQSSPELIDLGIFRPSITLSGIVDSKSSITTSPWMEEVSVTSRTSEYSEGVLEDNYNAKYYLPYKNVLENAVISWIHTSNTKLELQVGDVDIPTGGGSTSPTGGAIYDVAIQMCRFQQNAAQEDRWQFSLQLVAKAREDYGF